MKLFRTLFLSIVLFTVMVGTALAQQKPDCNFPAGVNVISVEVDTEDYIQLSFSEPIGDGSMDSVFTLVDMDSGEVVEGDEAEILPIYNNEKFRGYMVVLRPKTLELSFKKFKLAPETRMEIIRKIVEELSADG